MAIAISLAIARFNATRAKQEVTPCVRIGKKWEHFAKRLNVPWESLIVDDGGIQVFAIDDIKSFLEVQKATTQHGRFNDTSLAQGQFRCIIDNKWSAKFEKEALLDTRDGDRIDWEEFYMLAQPAFQKENGKQHSKTDVRAVLGRVGSCVFGNHAIYFMEKDKTGQQTAEVIRTDDAEDDPLLNPPPRAPRPSLNWFWPAVGLRRFFMWTLVFL